MGVEDLSGMDTPQKKGGRPKGSTTKKKKQSREVDGDPYTKDDGEEYWQGVWDRNHDEGGDLRKSVLNSAQYTSCLPRTVIENIHNRGIHSFEGLTEDPPEWFEFHLRTLDLEGINSTFAPSPSPSNNGGESSGLASLIGDEDDSNSGFLDDLDDDDDDDENNSGLSQLIG